MNLSPQILIDYKSITGTLLLYEYILPDYNFLHVVQWHDNMDKIELFNNELVPKIKACSFYREKDKALEYANKILLELNKFN